MRGAKYFLGALLFLAIVAGGTYLARFAIAGYAVRSAMASAGFEAPKARVTGLSLKKVNLQGVAAGPEGGEAFIFSALEARYRWRTLLSERRVDAVAIGPGTARLKIAPDGTVMLPGYQRKGGGEGAGALPFDRLTATGVVIMAEAPHGTFSGVLGADYDAASGGAVSLKLETQNAGYDAVTVEDGALNLEVELAADGSINLSGAFTGDVVLPQGPVRDLDFSITGQGRSWRGFVAGEKQPMRGHAQIALRSARVDISEIETLARITEERRALMFGAPVSTLSMSAGVDLSLTDDGLAASIGDKPIAMRADNGAELTIDALEGTPLIQRTDVQTKANFLFALTGAAVSMVGDVSAETTDDGWEIVAPMRIGEYRSDALSMDDASAVIRAATAPGRVGAEITTTTNLRSATIGRLNISDAPLTTNLLVDVDTAAKRAYVTVPAEKCINLQRARFTLARQDTDAALSNAKLCGGAAPLVVMTWSGAPQSTFAGELTAAAVRYRLGGTHFAGRPPEINFNGVYQPLDNETVMSGTVAGGSILLNEMLRFTGAEGRFDFALDREAMRSTGWLDAVRVTQHEESPRIAPVIASGKAELEARNIQFNYALRTPGGAALGKGDGVHNVTTATGSSAFVFNDIAFEKAGLQPDELAPVLKGFIGETIGAAGGSAAFSWAPSGGIASSAKFAFQDVTFGGPTRVVTKTVGLNGDLDFKSLWPVATEGVQTITVEGVDMDALQLESGQVMFDMPGDETVRVERAYFPWFGGELGVHEASASFAGGEAVAPLRADKVDLAQVLEYIDADGLSGQGLLSGVLPLIVEGGKARIENGVLKSDGSGAIRYRSEVAATAAATSDQAQIAFDLLRDLQYDVLSVTINGPLDGRLQFQIKAEGVGLLTRQDQEVAVPVKYNINLDAALLELLNQAVLSQDIQLLIETGQQGEE